MSNHRKFAADKEAILVALDQLSQTMEVMGQVVTRLKRSVTQAEIATRSVAKTTTVHIETDNANQHQRYSPRKSRQTDTQIQSEEGAKPAVVLH